MIWYYTVIVKVCRLGLSKACGHELRLGYQTDRGENVLSFRRDDSDVRPTTVALQPKPGIGDMIWQLPTLKALAANDPTGRIDLIAHEKLPAQALLAMRATSTASFLCP